MASTSSHGQIGVGKASASMSWRHTSARASGSSGVQHAPAARRRHGGERIAVDPQAAELLGGGGDDAQGARRCVTIGALLRDADEVGAGVVGADGAGVPARADLLERRLQRIQVRGHQAQHGAIEVARRAVVVDRGDLHVQLAVATGAEADIDPGCVLRGQRPAHQLRGQGPELGRSDPGCRPLLARVGGPRHRAAEAVLPLREQRVLAGGEE